MSVRLPLVLLSLVCVLAFVAPALAIPPVQAAPLDDATHAVVRIRGCNIQGCNLGVGSGVLTDPGGLILTAHHVTLSDPQNPLSRQLEEFVIEVTDSARTAPVARYRARVVAQKPAADLALLQIYWDETALHEVAAGELDLPYLLLTDPATVMPLDQLTILGYPLAGGRSINFVREDLSGFDEGGSLLKVQASLGEGNSGGPALVQRDGRYEIAGIVIERRGTLGEVGLIRSVGDLHDLDWAPGGRRAVASRVELSTALGDDGVIPVVRMDLRLFDLADRQLNLLAYAFDGATLAPYFPDDPSLRGTPGGQMVLKTQLSAHSFFELLDDRLIELPAVPSAVQLDALAFRFALWDVAEGRLLWSDPQFRRSQAQLAAALPAATNTLAPVAPPASPTVLPTSTPAPQPTATTLATPTPLPSPTPTAPRRTVNALGKELPADAAPLDQQVLVYPYDSDDNFASVDWFEQAYQRSGVTDLLSDSLFRLDKDFQVKPGAAVAWHIDDSGQEWVFELDQSLVWTDGRPVTAQDWVATFQYAADPNHAWDYSWYFSGVIRNWDQAVAGDVPVSAIGVTAIDDFTLKIETVAPRPDLPTLLVQAAVLSQRALTEFGPNYNATVDTSVSSGPYVLTEWSQGERLVFTINPEYRGTNIPYIQTIIVPGIPGDAMLFAYGNNDIDIIPAGELSPTEIQSVASDPVLRREYHPHYGNFRTHYFFFDSQNPPFDNVRVRQAFSHVLDRDALETAIIKQSGVAATSYLMPGFPGSNAAELEGIQSYDPDLAKLRLAEAGYPGGIGFPRLTLKLRGETALNLAVAQAYADAIKQELGIDVEIENLDYVTFIQQLNSRPTQIRFGMLSYGADYLDANAMLPVFLSDGRHNWNNPEFDDLVTRAARYIGDPLVRTRLFQDAEQLMVEDVAAVFAYHDTPGDLYKPYLKGEGLEPDANGVAAWHWPGFSTFSDLLSTLYVSSDVSDYRPPPR